MFQNRGSKQQAVTGRCRGRRACQASPQRPTRAWLPPRCAARPLGRVLHGAPVGLEHRIEGRLPVRLGPCRFRSSRAPPPRAADSRRAEAAVLLREAEPLEVEEQSQTLALLRFELARCHHASETEALVTFVTSVSDGQAPVPPKESSRGGRFVMHVLGVDLATEPKTTAACWLRFDGQTPAECELVTVRLDHRGNVLRVPLTASSIAAGRGAVTSLSEPRGVGSARRGSGRDVIPALLLYGAAGAMQ